MPSPEITERGYWDDLSTQLSDLSLAFRGRCPRAADALINAAELAMGGAIDEEERERCA